MLLGMVPPVPEARHHPAVPAQRLCSGDPDHLCPVAAGTQLPARLPCRSEPAGVALGSPLRPSLTQPCRLPATRNQRRAPLCHAWLIAAGLLVSPDANPGQVPQPLLSQEHLD